MVRGKKVIMKVDGNRFRQKRFAMFLALLDRSRRGEGPVRVLDIGGTISYWRALEPMWCARHLDVTIVNIVESEPSDEGILHIRLGDARSLDYADNSFDVIHSNSVIEHVGHWLDMIAMAREVRRIAPHYYLQTPNFWFPIEPHYRTAFMHWYPESMQSGHAAAQEAWFRQRGHVRTRRCATSSRQTCSPLDRWRSCFRMPRSCARSSDRSPNRLSRSGKCKCGSRHAQPDY